MRWIAALAITALAAVGVALADFENTLPPEIHHPAIDYFRGVSRDPVAELDRRLAQGPYDLTFEGRGGYLRSILAALDVPVESQIAVFSKTSFQQNIIEPGNPRTIFFNDQVAVAWMWGGFIELAAQDPERGTHFYTFQQDPRRQPRFVRTDNCLSCHQAEGTLGVAGMLVRSVFPGPVGEPMLIYGATFTDQRTPLAERWGGYYVTGSAGGARHMGNAFVTDRDNPAAEMTGRELASLDGKFPTARYLSPYSDIAALMVFDHQMRMMNLLTRFGWEVRADAASHSSDLARVLREGAREVVDYLLFVDEAPLKGRMRGSSGFTAQFAARGPRDSQGRSLRDLDLETRLMKYPCSYMIYSPLFEALPAPAKDAIYRRLHEVLAGQESGAKYARLTAADRRAITGILRETKAGLPDYF